MDHVSEIISLVVGFMTGAGAGSFVTFKMTKKSMSGQADRGGNSVNQAGAKASGDIVGRDKSG